MSWELAKRHEALLHTIYEDGELKTEVLEEIRKTLREDCLGSTPECMLWSVMQAAKDDPSCGPEKVKEVARRIVGPTQEAGALANSVHGLISIDFAVKALEQGDLVEAASRLKESQAMQRRLAPTKEGVKAAMGAVLAWAEDYGFEVWNGGHRKIEREEVVVSKAVDS